jgi:hypothetical protein
MSSVQSVTLTTPFSPSFRGLDWPSYALSSVSIDSTVAGCFSPAWSGYGRGYGRLLGVFWQRFWILPERVVLLKVQRFGNWAQAFLVIERNLTHSDGAKEQISLLNIPTAFVYVTTAIQLLVALNYDRLDNRQIRRMTRQHYQAWDSCS